MDLLWSVSPCAETRGVMFSLLFSCQSGSLVASDWFSLGAPKSRGEGRERRMQVKLGAFFRLLVMVIQILHGRVISVLWVCGILCVMAKHQDCVHLFNKANISAAQRRRIQKLFFKSCSHSLPCCLGQITFCRLSSQSVAVSETLHMLHTW